MSRRLLLLSGLGGDRRLFGALRAPGFELAAPDHLPPGEGETLEGYAERVADAHGLGPGDVVGGASFGGMLASQIAARRKVAGLVVLGSCLDPLRLPAPLRWLERAGPLVPDALLGLRTWGPLIRWRFHPLTPSAETCLRAMARDCPPENLRRFAAMIFGWPGTGRPDCPRLVVHGDLDRFIPIACAEPDLVLKGAGHAFTLTHPGETDAALAAFLSRLG